MTATELTALSMSELKSVCSASIVLLIPLILLVTLFLAVKAVITSLAWLIAALIPFVGRVRQSIDLQDLQPK